MAIDSSLCTPAIYKYTQPYLILFVDLDGTLVQFEGSRRFFAKTFCKVARSLGANTTEDELYQVVCATAYVDFFKKYNLNGEKFWKLADEVDLEKRKEALKSGEAALAPGAKELLETLHGKILIALVSDTPYAHVDLELDFLNIRKFFHAISCEDGTYHFKPNTHKAIKAMEHLHKTYPMIQPKWFLGDSKVDVDSARNMGIESILYDPADKKADLNPTYRIKNLREALPIILRKVA